MPQPISDDTIIPFGSKKGKKYSEVSDGYLQTLYDRGKISKALKEYIENRFPVLRVGKEKASHKDERP